MSRKSIIKHSWSSSFPTLNESDSEISEPIYHTCRGKLLLQKKLKSSKTHNQTDAEKLIVKMRSTQPQERMIYVTESGLRMKVYKKLTKNYNRIFLSYQQIEGIFLVQELKNIIILGIVSSDGQKRAYECLQIKENDAFVKLRTLLLKACNDDNRKLVGVRPIGTLSMVSLDNTSSRRGSLGSVIWAQQDNVSDKENFQENDILQKDLEENTNDVPRVMPSGGSSGSAPNISSGSPTDDEEADNHMNSNDELYDTDDNDLVHYHNDSNNDVMKETASVQSVALEKMDNLNEPLLTPIFHGNEESPVLYYRTGGPNTSLDDSEAITDLYPTCDWPAGVTFIHPDPVCGVKISHIGSVFLYCERVVKKDDDYSDDEHQL
ncbi:unnamed protein product [Trichobilharzia regenti]|uniref:PID domain-containing protein n=1 Tax=Trichobilharzia regenti TaxID=157069 RepID=A0A183VPU5_TRIRE|nr:unnamed protein product [Trichobilharzia regenti]VDP98381.1 unnamed protein product [Trichobilharzia regenti]